MMYNKMNTRSMTKKRMLFITNNLCGNNTTRMIHTTNFDGTHHRYNLRPRKVTSYYEESFVYHFDKQDEDYVPYVHSSDKPIYSPPVDFNPPDKTFNKIITRGSSPKTKNILTFITEIQTSQMEEEKAIQRPPIHRWVLRSSVKPYANQP